jgi:hypothetical protein
MVEKRENQIDRSTNRVCSRLCIRVTAVIETSSGTRWLSPLQPGSALLHISFFHFGSNQIRKQTLIHTLLQLGGEAFPFLFRYIGSDHCGLERKRDRGN